VPLRKSRVTRLLLSRLPILLFAACGLVSACQAQARVYTLAQAIDQALLSRAELGGREAVRDRLVAEKEIQLAEKAVSLDVAGSASGSRFASQFSAGLSKRLYAGQGFKDRVGAADSLTASADAQIRQQRRAIALEVATTFWRLEAAQYGLELQERLVGQLSELAETIEIRFEMGTVSRRERDEARILLGDSRVALEAERGHRRLQAMEFLAAIGAGARATDDPVVATEPPRTGREEATLPELIAQALLTRPELEALQAKVDAHEQTLAAARVKNLFTLDLSGGYRWRGYDYLVVDQREAVNSFAFLALTGRYHSNWRLHRAHASLAETDRRLALMDLEAERTGISWQVAKAHESRETLGRQLAEMKKTVELSESNLQAAMASFEVGRLPVMEVFTVHLDLAERRVRLHRLGSDLAIADLELDWAVGARL